MSGQLDALKQKLGQLSDLGSLGALANWDQQTKMPVHGGEARARSLATLAGLTHELFVDAETGRLIEGAAAELEVGGRDPDLDSDDARLIALTRRDWEKARRVPSALASEMAHAASAGQEAWVAAREAGDFAAFAPSLERNIELARRYVDCHSADGFACAYDVLLDDYEPQMASTEVVALFDELKAELVPLIAAVAAASPVDDAPLTTVIPVPEQRRVVRDVLGLMGFDGSGWRMDDTIHPFAVSVSEGDVRVTTRFEPDYWPMGLYGAMHETGHGLYEAGIGSSLRRTPLGAIDSLALHESQSRLWENMVGRGRSPDVLFRAVNRTGPSLIRVEADEATYGLHIILRFELEQELIDGRLAVADLPEAWNARVREFLGLEVTNAGDGVLQDVHWSAGLIGYFPTYALGNLIAGQLWERAHEEIADLDGQLRAGELGELREWLRRRVHVHGAKYATGELLRREAGGPVSVGPVVRYLKAKLADVYGLALD